MPDKNEAPRSKSPTRHSLGDGALRGIKAEFRRSHRQ